MKRLYPDAQLVKTQSTHELEFRAFSTKGFLGQDVMVRAGLHELRLVVSHQHLVPSTTI